MTKFHLHFSITTFTLHFARVSEVSRCVTLVVEMIFFVSQSLFNVVCCCTTALSSAGEIGTILAPTGHLSHLMR